MDPVIWFVPIVSRVTGATTVVEIPAALIVFAIMDCINGRLDRGLARYAQLLLNTRLGRKGTSMEL
jgi:hypothetical protein